MLKAHHHIIMREKLCKSKNKVNQSVEWEWVRELCVLPNASVKNQPKSALQGPHAALVVNGKSEERHWYRWIHLWWNYDHREAKGPVGPEHSARHSWVQPQAWTESSCWGSSGHSVTKMLLSLPPKKGSNATPFAIAASLLFSKVPRLLGWAASFFNHWNNFLIFIVSGFKKRNLLCLG